MSSQSRNSKDVREALTEAKMCWITPICITIDRESESELRDLYGKVQEELFSPAAGPILFLVTSLATSPGEPLLAVGQLA